MVQILKKLRVLLYKFFALMVVGIGFALRVVKCRYFRLLSGETYFMLG